MCRATEVLRDKGKENQRSACGVKQKEQEIQKKLEELTTKDLYLKAYSRRQNIKFNRIPETRGEDTEEVCLI